MQVVLRTYPLLELFVASMALATIHQTSTLRVTRILFASGRKNSRPYQAQLKEEAVFAKTFSNSLSILPSI